MASISSSTVCWLFLLSGSAVYCLNVKLKSTFNDVTKNAMPEDINVTVSTETDYLTTLYLKRDRDFNLDIPLFTINSVDGGLPIPQKVTNIEKKILSVYQDKENKAFVQLSQTLDQETKLAKLNMKGDYKLGASRYFFDTDKKSKTSLHALMTTSVSIDEGSVYVMESTKSESLRKFASVETPEELEKMVKRIGRGNEVFQHNKETVSDRHFRYRRAGITDYYIDVVAVVDYSIYRQFLTEAQSFSSRALQNILEHYAFVFNWIDHMFASMTSSFKIHIRLSKVYVLQSVSASYFIENLVSSGSVDSEKCLAAFRSYSGFIGTGYGIVKGYDHAMLFTGYKLRDPKSLVPKYLGSTAYTSTMCRTDGYSSSVNKDSLDYDSFFNGIRSISYSLSGENSFSALGCSENNMIDTDTFLSCNQQHFLKFISETVGTSRGYTCLVYAQDPESDLPNLLGKLPGQLALPDKQCRTIYGGESYFCRSVEDNVTISDICHSMYCSDPQDDTKCFMDQALPGTSCGDGKFCLKGQCVRDERAPQVDENCMFGDEPEQSNNVPCSSLIRNITSLCYHEYPRTICCESCSQVYQAIQGCEYGNRLSNCTSSHCTMQAQDCCTTCNYGSPFIPTTTTRRQTQPYYITSKRPGCTLGDRDRKPEQCTNPSICRTNPENCCNYCLDNFNSNPIGNENTASMKTTDLFHIISIISTALIARP